MAELSTKSCYRCVVEFRQENNEAEGQRSYDCRCGWLDAIEWWCGEYRYHVIYDEPRNFRSGTQRSYFTGWHRLSTIDVDFSVSTAVAFTSRQLGTDRAPLLANDHFQRLKKNQSSSISPYSLFLRDVQDNDPARFSFMAVAARWNTITPDQREHYKNIAKQMNSQYNKK